MSYQICLGCGVTVCQCAQIKPQEPKGERPNTYHGPHCCKPTSEFPNPELKGEKNPCWDDYVEDLKRECADRRFINGHLQTQWEDQVYALQTTLENQSIKHDEEYRKLEHLHSLEVERLQAKLREFDEYYTFQNLELVEKERDEWRRECRKASFAACSEMRKSEKLQTALDAKEAELRGLIVRLDATVNLETELTIARAELDEYKAIANDQKVQQLETSNLLSQARAELDDCKRIMRENLDAAVKVKLAEHAKETK